MTRDFHIRFAPMTAQNHPKSFTRWQVAWLLLLLVVAVNFAIRWRLRELPLERDEGEYAYAGQLLLQGIPPYQLAWNMKFPGTYVAYAGLMSLFGQTAEGIHLGIILVTSASTGLLFLIGRRLLGDGGGLMAAALFVLTSALPATAGLAGHATHFVVLFVCAGTYALLRSEASSSVGWPLAAGAALGVAILMKQHAAVFAVAAAGWQLRRECATRKWPWRTGIFTAGAGLPLAVTALWLVQAGVWPRFVFWTVEYARQYVSLFPVSAMPRQLAGGFGPIFASGIWVWLLGTAALALVFLPTPYRRAAGWGAAGLVGGLVAASPGFYYRNHYFLMALPGLALLNAALLLAVANHLKHRGLIRLEFLPACLFCVVAGDLCIRNAAAWTRLEPLEVCRKIYGYSPFPEAPEIARYLAAHTVATDTLAVLGSEPEIFFLAHRPAASGYIYVYSLTEPQPLAAGMRLEYLREIASSQPKYVVYVNIRSSWQSVMIPGETDAIMDQFEHWWNDYATHYQLVGMVDQAEGKPSEFFWDEQLSGRTNPSPANLSIYRRK